MHQWHFEETPGYRHPDLRKTAYFKGRYDIFLIHTYFAHILHTNDFSTKEGRVSYLESIVKKSKNSPEVKDKIQLSVDSHLLTLSTCVSRQADKRFVVQAILLNEEQL